MTWIHRTDLSQSCVDRKPHQKRVGRVETSSPTEYINRWNEVKGMSQMKEKDKITGKVNESQ